MDPMWIWIIVGIVVLVVVIGLVAMLAKGSKRKKIEHDRAEAARMRDEAAEHERKVREAKADSSTADADARTAQAEADLADAEAKRRAAQADQEAADAERRKVDAERLQDNAQLKTQDVHHAERTHDEQLRAADAKDPDVRTNEDGQRVEDGQQARPGDDGGRNAHRDDVRSEQGSEPGKEQPTQNDATQHDRPGFTDKDHGDVNRSRGTDDVDGPPAR